MTWRRRVRPGLGLTTLLAGAWAGCNSPTLPLPPPDVPELAEISLDGTSVHLVGLGAVGGALVLIYNDSIFKGAIVTADPHGRYDAVVPTDLTPGSVNEMEMWQRVGKDDSSAIVFLIPLHGTFNPAADAGRSVEGGSMSDAGIAGGEP
jgi:hypothetical protein